MGALEFVPTLGPGPKRATPIEIDALVRLASDVLTQRNALHGNLADGDQEKALNDILRVGTSAGGARAKAVIAWHPQTGEEIGRASCRERVCQTVELSGVAGPLKNKKEKKSPNR